MVVVHGRRPRAVGPDHSPSRPARQTPPKTPPPASLSVHRPEAGSSEPSEPLTRSATGCDRAAAKLTLPYDHG